MNGELANHIKLLVNYRNVYLAAIMVIVLVDVERHHCSVVHQLGNVDSKGVVASDVQSVAVGTSGT